MNHEQFKEWLQLSLYDELSAEEQAALTVHLQSCEECAGEIESLRRLHSALGAVKPAEPNDAFLTAARHDLRAALRIERNRSTFASRLREIAGILASPKAAIALGGVAVLVIGVFAGSYMASRNEEKFAQMPGKTVAMEQNGWQNLGQLNWPDKEQNGDGGEAPAFNAGDVHISNVKILDNNPAAGEVEFTFDAITPMHIKGSVNDERVQKVLTHALLNNDNPGVRLRSVTAFAAQKEVAGQPGDPEVKKALLKALRADENPAVRKEALRALQKLPFDADIKKAFLDVLVKDKNSGIRIAVINTLDSAKTGGKFDDDILEVLKQKMHNDDNNYIRLRAKAVVQENHR